MFETERFGRCAGTRDRLPSGISVLSFNLLQGHVRFGLNRPLWLTVQLARPA